jgi:hypothetical protein
MDDVGIFYSQLVYFVAIRYILCEFGIFFPVLLCCTKENLATLLNRIKLEGFKIETFLSNFLSFSIRNLFECFFDGRKSLEMDRMCNIDHMHVCMYV